MEVEPHEAARDDGHDGHGHDADHEAERHVDPADAAHEGLDEHVACGQARACEEEREAPLPEHQVGGDGRVRDEMKARAVVAQQDGRDERAARKTELDLGGHARKGDRNAAQNEAERDADEDREDVGPLKPLLLIAHHGRQTRHGVGRTHAVERVADLQAQRVVGKEHDARAVDARDVHAVHSREVQVLDERAVDLLARDADEAGDERRVRGRKVDLRVLIAAEGDDRLLVARLPKRYVFSVTKPVRSPL